MFVILYSTRLVLNTLGEVDFGIFNIVGGVVAMLGFMNMAMASTMQRFLNYEEGKNDINIQTAIFNIGIVFHLVIAILLLIVFVIVGFVFFNGVLNIPEQRTDAAIIVYSSLIVSTVFTVLTVPYDSVLNAHENMLYYSVVGIIESLLRLLIAFFVVYTNGDKLIVYGIMMSFVPVFSMFLMRVYCRKKYLECRVSVKKYFDKSLAKKMVSFASWNLLGTMTNMFGNYGNGIVLNHFFGATLNAAAGIANQIQGQLMVLSSGMMKALSPRITKEEGLGNTASMMQYSYMGCKYSFFLLSIFAVPFIVETPFLLKIWLKNVPQWTVLFVQLQLMRALLEQLTVSLKKSLEAVGKIKGYNIASLFFNLLPIPILYTFYRNGFQPYWHYIVAITSMVGVETIVKMSFCKKYCGFKILDLYRGVFFPSAAFSIPAFICVLFWTQILNASYLRLLICFLSSLIVQFLFFYVSLSSIEKNSMSTSIINIKNRKMG